MCGRYTQTQHLKEIVARFAVDAPFPPWELRYNIAPSQEAPVVINQNGRRLELFRWGLIPSFAQDAASGAKMINARAETIAEKPSFKGPFQRRRCLVVADGFYEWKKLHGGKGKAPMRILMKSKEPFAMAGLWDAWKDPAGKEIRSFTIITTAAAESLKAIHERMPAILAPKDEALWLDAEADAQRLLALLAPCQDELLTVYEVSPLVNSAANDEPRCIEPIES